VVCDEECCAGTEEGGLELELVMLVQPARASAADVKVAATVAASLPRRCMRQDCTNSVHLDTARRGHACHRAWLLTGPDDPTHLTHPRRLVGIDPEIASRQSVWVLEADGRAMCRSSCVPTVESLALVERSALAAAPDGTMLVVVFEPTGAAWMPVAAATTR